MIPALFGSTNRLLGLTSAVKARVRQEHRERCLPGNVLISTRVTQVYREGACVYVYIALYCKGVADPCGTYKEIEEAAREEIARWGGSVSHHHGVGKLKGQWIQKCNSSSNSSDNYSSSSSATGMKGVIVSLKKSMDPGNVFGVRNNLLNEEGGGKEEGLQASLHGIEHEETTTDRIPEQEY